MGTERAGEKGSEWKEREEKRAPQKEKKKTKTKKNSIIYQTYMYRGALTWHRGTLGEEDVSATAAARLGQWGGPGHVAYQPVGSRG